MVPNLAGSSLLGAPFIDRFAHSIHSGDRRVVLWHSKPGALFDSFHKRNPSTNVPLALKKLLESFTPTDAHPVRLAMQVWIPPSTAYPNALTIVTASLMTIVPRNVPPQYQLLSSRSQNCRSSFQPSLSYFSQKFCEPLRSSSRTFDHCLHGAARSTI